MKFKIDERVVITSEDLLDNGNKHKGAIGITGKIIRYDNEDNSYLIEIEEAFNYFDEGSKVWVVEEYLNFISPISLEPYFTPVVDEHRNHPDVELI